MSGNNHATFKVTMKKEGANKFLRFRVSDKKAAKTYNIRNFPALSLFRNGEPTHFEASQSKLCGGKETTLVILLCLGL